MTRAEALLWRALRNRQLDGLKFRRQHPIGRFRTDFASEEARLVVEVDGATHSTEAELASDGERTRVLESHGFLVIRFTNEEVFRALDGVLETIRTTARASGGL